MTDLKIVRVVWVDSHYFPEGWHLKDEIDDIIESASDCESVGFVVRETKDILTLALSISEHQYGAMMVIPKLAIKSLVELSLPKGEST